VIRLDTAKQFAGIYTERSGAAGTGNQVGIGNKAEVTGNSGGL
jgi:hypothetical protein